MRVNHKASAPSVARPADPGRTGSRGPARDTPGGRRCGLPRGRRHALHDSGAQACASPRRRPPPPRPAALLGRGRPAHALGRPRPGRAAGRRPLGRRPLPLLRERLHGGKPGAGPRARPPRRPRGHLAEHAQVGARRTGPLRARAGLGPAGRRFRRPGSRCGCRRSALPRRWPTRRTPAASSSSSRASSASSPTSPRSLRSLTAPASRS